MLFTNQVEGKNKLILIVMILVLGIYLFTKLPFLKSYDELIESPVNARIEQTISGDDLKESDGRFGISCWIYVDDWNYKYGQKKTILRKEVSTTNNSSIPEIYLDPYQNNLEINLDVYGSDSEINDYEALMGANYNASSTYDCIDQEVHMDDEKVTTTDGAGNTISIPCVNSTTQNIKIENINIQKWVNIIMTVNNRTVDTYINGKLVKTVAFNNVIDTAAFNSGGIIICPNGGFGGYISKTQYYPYFITPVKAWSIYREGFGDTLETGLNKYNLALSFYEDAVEKKKYYIF